MRALALAALAILAPSPTAHCQESGSVLLQRIKGLDLPDNSSVCLFYLAPPDGDGTEKDLVLAFEGIEGSDAIIQINGKMLRLKWSPEKIKTQTVNEFSGIWTHKGISIELHHKLASETENSSYYEGTLLVRIGTKYRQYKINGVCGC